MNTFGETVEIQFAEKLDIVRGEAGKATKE
jgi:hypothetical protein